MLLYFVRSKNDAKCKNFAVLLCFMSIHSILFSFLRLIFRKGATAPLNLPLIFYYQCHLPSMAELVFAIKTDCLAMAYTHT